MPQKHQVVLLLPQLHTTFHFSRRTFLPLFSSHRCPSAKAHILVHITPSLPRPGMVSYGSLTFKETSPGQGLDFPRKTRCCLQAGMTVLQSYDAKLLEYSIIRSGIDSSRSSGGHSRSFWGGSAQIGLAHRDTCSESDLVHDALREIRLFHPYTKARSQQQYCR